MNAISFYKPDTDISPDIWADFKNFQEVLRFAVQNLPIWKDSKRSWQQKYKGLTEWNYNVFICLRSSWITTNIAQISVDEHE